jgi:flagellar biosynthesis anti-sigma factor FlgM
MIKINPGDTPDTTRMELNPTRATSETNGPAASNSASGSRTPSSDSIAISGTNGLVQQALGAGSATRAARVQELQRQFQSGQYQVDPMAVSRALISLHLAGE